MADRKTSISAWWQQAARLITLALLPLTQGIAQESAVELTVTGIEEITGNLAVAVFDSRENFDARTAPAAQALLPVDAESITLTLTLPKPGDYAIIVYQDMNLNGQIDLSRIGIPTEPYGFGNNARSTFGPPGFRRTRISVAQGATIHEIRLR